MALSRPVGHILQGLLFLPRNIWKISISTIHKTSLLRIVLRRFNLISFI